MIYSHCEQSMKKKFLEFSMNSIKKKFPDYSEEKLEEIEYGIEALYLTFTKAIVITLFSIMLGVIKEVFLIMIFYNIIRTTAFGMHAKTSLQCYIISTVLFVIISLISKHIDINGYIKIVAAIICFVHIIIFAPADTYKRPLINKRKRKIYKVITIINSFIYVVLIILFKDSITTTYVMFGLIDATLMIHPLIYRMFQLPYNNYKAYNESYS